MSIHAWPTERTGRGSLGGRIALKLRQDIFLRHYSPGHHLAEPELAERFEVSRAPVRDALSQLQQEGLVRRGRRGLVVAELTTTWVFHLYDLRRMLEIEASLEATRRIGEIEERLRASADQMAVALQYNQDEEYALADIAFHDTVFKAAEHQWVQRVWLNIRDLCYALLSTVVGEAHRAKPDAAQRAVALHIDVVEALKGGDPEVIRATVHAHYGQVPEVILGLPAFRPLD